MKQICSVLLVIGFLFASESGKDLKDIEALMKMDELDLIDSAISSDLSSLDALDENITQEFKKEVDTKLLASRDLDEDGLNDLLDRCPDTMKEYISLVDKEGCVNNLVLAIQFKADSFEIQDKYIQNIKPIATYLKKHPTFYIQITGHTSADKTTNVGLKLSENRALSVKKHLIDFGIEGLRLYATGVGGHHPLVSNATSEGRMKNRRIEIKIFRD